MLGLSLIVLAFIVTVAVGASVGAVITLNLIFKGWGK